MVQLLPFWMNTVTVTKIAIQINDSVKTRRIGIRLCIKKAVGSDKAISTKAIESQSLKFKA